MIISFVICSLIWIIVDLVHRRQLLLLDNFITLGILLVIRLLVLISQLTLLLDFFLFSLINLDHWYSLWLRTRIHLRIIILLRCCLILFLFLLYKSLLISRILRRFNQLILTITFINIDNVVAQYSLLCFVLSFDSLLLQMLLVLFIFWLFELWLLLEILLGHVLIYLLVDLFLLDLISDSALHRYNAHAVLHETLLIILKLITGLEIHWHDISMIYKLIAWLVLAECCEAFEWFWFSLIKA